MSDIGSTFFTMANALVSPKAIIKFLSIAFSLILTWLYISPLLSELAIPVEYFSFIVLLIGMGLGSLLGIIISWICEFLLKKYKKKKKKELDFQRRELERTQDEEEQRFRDIATATKLEASIDYLGVNEKETLYMLSQKNITIEHREYYDSVLLDNDYIQTISRIDSSKVLVKLNTALLNIVQTHFENYKKREVESFLKSHENAEYLLDLLDVNNSEATTLIPINALKGLSLISNHISVAYLMGEGYRLSFGTFMCEAFEESTGRKYSDELFIPSNRIQMTDSSADS